MRLVVFVFPGGDPLEWVGADRAGVAGLPRPIVARSLSQVSESTAVGAHCVAGLSETPTLDGTGGRVCRLAMAALQYYYSGVRLLCGVGSLRVSGERKRVAPTRSEATPSRGDNDEPKHHLFRQRAPSAGSFHQQLKSIAKSATTTTEGAWSMDEATTNEVDLDSEQLGYDSIHCDVLPHSPVYQFLHAATLICGGMPSELKQEKSKKPQRLSTTTSDLFD